LNEKVGSGRSCIVPIRRKPSRIAASHEEAENSIAGRDLHVLEIARNPLISSPVSYLHDPVVVRRAGLGVRYHLPLTDVGRSQGGIDRSVVAYPDHPVPFAVIPVATERRSVRAAQSAVVADEDGNMCDSFLTH